MESPSRRLGRGGEDGRARGSAGLFGCRPPELGVVGDDHRRDEESDHHGEEPRGVVDELGGGRGLERGEQKAHPREAALTLGQKTG